jgi:YfiH family protein
VYAARLTHGPVELAFTDRHDGVSGAPYDTLNLAWAGGDEPAAMEENHRLVMGDFAPGAGLASLAQLSQVHGNDVAVVGPDGPAHDVHGHLHAVGDGLVTTQPGVSLMVRAADCVPVLFADESGGVIGAAHCGRPGLVAGIVPATVAAMRELGAGRLTAWVGPSICGRCYEVPEQMRDDVAAVEPASRATTSWGTPAVDVGAGVRAQLERDRVAVVDLSSCTRESPDLFSYRRDGRASGRQAGVIRIAS